MVKGNFLVIHIEKTIDVVQLIELVKMWKKQYTLDNVDGIICVVNHKKFYKVKTWEEVINVHTILA